MATHALRKMHLTTSGTTSPAVPDRINASAKLSDWLKDGGPAPVKHPRAPDAPPLVHLSEAFDVVGTEDNVMVVAKRPIGPGHFVIGVAKRSVLHPRAEPVSVARQNRVAELANKVRAWRTGGEGLLGEADDAYRIDLVLLVAIELLEGTNSKWAPYLASLPQFEAAAPPSLWPYLLGGGATSGAAGTRVLREHTSLASLLAVDVLELAPLFSDGSPAAQALHGPSEGRPTPSEAAMALGDAVLRGVASEVAGTTISGARTALLRSLALVTTRMIGGVGLVPLLDLCNGAAEGAHNATIEQTQLAVSNEAPEAAPCVAVVTSQRIEQGEEVLLAYGKYSAARFLYTYGWAMGGPDTASGASTAHDTSVVVPRSLWPALTDAQRLVLAKYKITPRALGVDADVDTNAPAGGPAAVGRRPAGPSPFALPKAEAAAGETTPMMRQVGLLASICDEGVLYEIAQTGKLGTTHGVGAAEIATRVVGWCAAHADGLAEAAITPEVIASASVSARTRMALRVAHNERANLIEWMGALKEKHELGGGVLALVDEASAKHKLCRKRLKQAIKAAESSAGEQLVREQEAAKAVDVD